MVSKKYNTILQYKKNNIKLIDKTSISFNLQIFIDHYLFLKILIKKLVLFSLIKKERWKCETVEIKVEFVWNIKA